ncbi:MAG: lipid A biosynthesis acyltransferase [Archangium gephyra]|uniref:Lipid A biosynthesis acyltransferase n=1 Tax=Archangium gephyra TaxID=48 RepID=A0A2W5T6G4_9BACT|nr:MAG: lipid A biosynthesis acyltransferase [Archangium gephyra]
MLARFFVGLAVRWVRWLSELSRRRIAAAVATFAWTVRIRRRVAVDNVRRALPEKSEGERLRIARGSYESMALAALESITSDLMPDAALDAAVSVVEWKGLDVLLANRQPVLIASAHLGSWELFAEVMARRGHVFSAVVRPLTGAFNEWVVENRKRAGVELILQRGALRKMLAALKRGRAVVQLIDQALPSPQALWVPFFGRLASTTPAVSMAALHTGAPTYVVTAVRNGAALKMSVEGPVSLPSEGTKEQRIAAHTTELSRIIEAKIREAPEQWLWLHRRWKGKPPSDGQAQQHARLDDGRVEERAEL